MIIVMGTTSLLFATSQLDSSLSQAKSTLDHITNSFLNGQSVIAFFVALTLAIILGRIIAGVMRVFTRNLSRRADKAENLQTVNKLRRIETLTILMVALVRMLLVIAALYFWWVYNHPSDQPTALIGASALALLILSGAVSPILRDLAYGGVMMAEHWFGVGDFIRVEPFADLEGVVERVTLRSTRIRGMNGEIIWLNNQTISGVRVSPKGVRTMAIELFASDLKRGLLLLEAVNLRLPAGPLLVVRELRIMDQKEVAPNLWHITTIGETAPGREWLLQDYAIKLLKELDATNHPQILATDPIARYADSDAERRFARTVQNARKSSLRRKRLPLPDVVVEQISKPLEKTKQKQLARRKRRIQ